MFRWLLNRNYRMREKILVDRVRIVNKTSN